MLFFFTPTFISTNITTLYFSTFSTTSRDILGYTILSTTINPLHPVTQSANQITSTTSCLYIKAPFSPTSISSPRSPPMSSPAPSPMSSPVPYTENERLKTALHWEKYNNHNTSEYHIARYVLLIVLKVFDMLQCNIVPQCKIVPQFYTLAEKRPDLVLESFDPSRGKERTTYLSPECSSR